MKFESAMAEVVSTHAPAKGATLFDDQARRRALVSTHAPAKGATFAIKPICTPKISFNTRSREGSDPQFYRLVQPTSKFQHTLPRRERPKRAVAVFVALRFQHTLPRRERLVPTPLILLSQQFQHTLPRRERLHKRSLLTSPS